MQILFLMADGFEETEFVTPFDYLQRAGFEAKRQATVVCLLAACRV